MKRILLTMLAGLLVSCGISTKSEESSSELSRQTVPVKVTVDYAESMGLALLLGQLPHTIEISNCISFNAGEIKTVEYMNENDELASTTNNLPIQIDDTENEIGGQNGDVKGYINLYFGDTGCEADLTRFRHEGLFYEKAPAADQPPSASEMILYRAVDVPDDDKKEFWVQNLSDLDQIGDQDGASDDTQIKFAVFKSFEKNQIQTSINVDTEWEAQDSTLQDKHLGRFDIETITQTYDAQLRRETIAIKLICSEYEDGDEAVADDVSCNDSDVSDAEDTDIEEDTRFHIFKRDPSKTSFSIQEIIDHVSNQRVGENEELLDGSSLKGWVDEISDGDAAYTSAADYWNVYFSFPHSTLYEGSNSLVLVVEHFDEYAPDDVYSSSFRYHLIRLDYHNLD